MIRVGQGIDSHAFCSGDHLVLGGIEVPAKFGVRAHSDGDVILHALCDALLGAVGLRDIGFHFPDTDPCYRQVDSKSLLTMVYQKVMALGWKLGNADITVIAETPKLSPYIPAMCQRIAEILNCNSADISIKAKTAEKLGALGREEGIAVHAVVLVVQ